MGLILAATMMRNRLVHEVDAIDGLMQDVLCRTDIPMGPLLPLFPFKDLKESLEQKQAIERKAQPVPQWGMSTLACNVMSPGTAPPFFWLFVL